MATRVISMPALVAEFLCVPHRRMSTPSGSFQICVAHDLQAAGLVPCHSQERSGVGILCMLPLSTWSVHQSDLCSVA